MCNPRVLLLVLAACVGPDDIDDANDRDDDGYEAFQAGGDDCDDGDAAVNPGADEVCGNGTDDDCDGFVDDDGVGAITYYPDVDLDTFGEAAGAVSACSAPTGHVLVAGDCNDGATAVNPDATEVWYDGIDQDCDVGDDYDQDGDGFQSAAETVAGDDCDDLAFAVKPGATEVCGNLVDDDCDGGHDGCDWSGGDPVRTHQITMGSSVTPFASVGDCDDDGKDDMVLWFPDDGDVHFFWGGWVAATDMTLLDGLPVFTMPTPQTGHPLAVSIAQDLTGDGGADLVVGTWRPSTTGEVLLFDQLTRVMQPFDPGDFTRRWTGPSDSSPTVEGFGSKVVALGRVPGATLGSVAFPYRSNTATYSCLLHHDAPESGAADLTATVVLDTCVDVVPGALAVQGGQYVLGRIESTYHLADSASANDIDVSVQPEAALWPGSTDATALRVADLDDDGYGDVLAIETGLGDPAVRVPYGPIVGDGDPPQYYLRLEADPAVVEEYLDVHVADLNGDGHADLVVLMDLVFTGDPGGTAVGVLFGPIGPPDIEVYTDVDRAFFDAVIDVPTTERAASMHVGDIDGDGYDDVVLPGPGRVRVLYGAGR